MLKKMREKNGMTQKELSEATNINVRTLQSYESTKGRSIDNAGLNTLVDVSIALDCNISDLLDDKNLIDKCKKTSL